MSVRPSDEPGAWERLLTSVERRIRRGSRLRRNLPGGGRIHMDRPLPLLALHRSRGAEDPGTGELVTALASYVVAHGGEGAEERVERGPAGDEPTGNGGGGVKAGVRGRGRVGVYH